MTARNPLRRDARWRLRTSHLWLLSAALGTATIVHMVLSAHDNRQWRTSVGMVAQSTAEQVAARADSRLEVLAVETFAPAMPWASPGPSKPREALDALVAAQREGERCRCREMLPVTSFFRFDTGRGALDVVRIGDGTQAAASVQPDVLTEFARHETSRTPGPWLSSIHLQAKPRLGDQALLTVVQRDRSGAAVAVFGALASAREAAHALFTTRPSPIAINDSVFGLAALEMHSIVVSAGDSTPLFGSLGADEPYRATVQTHGRIEGLGVTVAVAPTQLHLTGFVRARNQLWVLGLLLLCTVLVTVIAVGSSRREVLLERARSDFIAGVSHDLRMPLAQILLASETLTLQRERDDRERLGLASSIVRETRRLIALVENVLLFSRSGAVALHPRLQPVPVGDLLGDVVEAVQLSVDDARQAIEVRDPGPGPLAVWGDRELLRQALVNLVDNALKYGQTGQRIRLSAERHSPTVVHLCVDDDGPGVPPAERTRVFEPYERLPRDQTSERTGTGLGLAVVRHIAQACEGRVWLADAPSGGTRAVLELRAAESIEQAVPSRAPSPAAYQTPESV